MSKARILFCICQFAQGILISAAAVIVSNANTLIFLFCCAAYLCTEIKTRPERAQTDDFCTRYARKTAKICLSFAHGNGMHAPE